MNKIFSVLTAAAFSLGLGTVTCVWAHNSLEFKTAKISGMSLGNEFLSHLKGVFNTNVFIETGTWKGDTTLSASKLFTDVHSIELGKKIYEKARKRFAKIKNVKLYLGDSKDLMPTMIENASGSGRMLFWLDGHYSGSHTALGELSTPIMVELQAIKDSGIRDAVLLIDDVCCFQPITNPAADSLIHGYPSISVLKEAILDVNENYKFLIYGDIAIAYTEDEPVGVSAFLLASTISRSDVGQEADYKELLAADEVIANTVGQERTSVEELAVYRQDSEYGVHYTLWNGLIYMREGLHTKAYNAFADSIAHKFDHWRAHWYLAQAAHKLGRIKEAQNALNKVLTAEPSFTLAAKLLGEIQPY